MKLAVIGGGGVRSMFLAKTLVQRAEELKIEEIVFMDNDRQKLNIYGKMAKKVAELINPKIKFTLTESGREAVKNANYVITTIRVGGDLKRIDDERAALDEGVLGQETTGAAGFSFAMRSVPALVKYCELIKEHSAKGVKVFNFTNPAGLVSQTLRDLGYDFTFGICDAPSGLLKQIADMYKVEVEELTADCYGLNHLTFFGSLLLNGKNILPELLENDDLYSKTEMCFFDKELTKHMGCLLNEYLYYFFYREQAVANILAAGETRGEVIKDINIRMTNELAKVDIENDFATALKIYEKWYSKREEAYMSNETGVARNKAPFTFEVQSEDVGGYAGVALQYIKTAQTGIPADMIMCVPNNGAIPGLADDDVVEVTCTITKDGYTTHPVENPGEVQMEIISRVNFYERKGSGALRNRDKSAAIEALMLHPLVNSYSIAKKLVNKYEEINKEYFTFEK